MELLIIGKPAMNVYMPLQEYPQEGDVFTITGKNESLGGVAAVSACLFAKWGIKPHFTGVLGNDAYGEKIRNTFSEYKVETRHLETNFEKGTAVNYIILNVKNGNVTKIRYNDPNVELTKYKYDFQPEWAIMDGSDTAGAMALINNDSKVNIVFYARIADQNTITLAKRCKYIVATQTFVEGITKTKVDIEGTTEDYVNLYQKLVDTSGSNNYVVLLNNKKILYSEDNKVKMLPEMKINHADVSSFDAVFTGAYTYALINNLSLDEAVKFANTAAAISLSKIGEEPAIPTLDEALDNSGLRDRFKIDTTQIANVGPKETTEAQETAPHEETPAPITQEPQVDAFAQAPNGTENIETPQPAETPQPVETPAPAQAAAPAETTVPPHEETNIFG